jgi:hypothetical protein
LGSLLHLILNTSIMKTINIFILAILFSSCENNPDIILTKSGKSILTARTQNYLWDICRPTSESNASFIVTCSSCTTLSFTPSCGSPNCVDDGSGTLSSQSQVIIVCSGSSDPSWNSSTCTLTLPVNKISYIRQNSAGTCQTNGFDFDPTPCPSTPDGSIYIKSQVYPSCTPYVTKSSCVDIVVH